MVQQIGDKLFPSSNGNIKETQLQRYYAPYNFKQIIGKMNPLFYGNQASDSKDLLFFILFKQ